MTDTIRDDEITSQGPTEGDEDLDEQGEGAKDTGDEPTEADEDLDAPGEGGKDSGDEA